MDGLPKFTSFDDYQRAWKEQTFWRNYKSFWDDLDDWDSWGEYPKEYEEEMAREKTEKWDDRDQKRHKKREGMKVDGSSVKVLLRILNKKIKTQKGS